MNKKKKVSVLIPPETPKRKYKKRANPKEVAIIPIVNTKEKKKRAEGESFGVGALVDKIKVLKEQVAMLEKKYNAIINKLNKVGSAWLE